MKELSNRAYLLAIKRNNNDYLPLEWHLLDIYSGENLLTLEGIDSFTKKITRLDLINAILRANIVDKEEQYQGFAIIYHEKGKYRELKDGPIFKEDTNILSINAIIGYIITNIDNKQNLSEIYNICNLNIEDKKLEEIKYIIRNIDYFKIQGEKVTYAALSVLNDLSYAIKRSIIIKLSRKIIEKCLNNNENPILIKRDYSKSEDKVA